MQYINLNQNIFFKAKPLGKEVLKKKGHNLTANEKGFFKLPLCEFMNIFGEFMVTTVGLKPNPYIDFDVGFHEKDMWDDSIQEDYERTIQRNKLL